MNKKLITEEQKDYQKELMSNFRDFCDKLEPMVNVKKKHKRSRYINIIVTVFIRMDHDDNLQGQSFDQYCWNRGYSKLKTPE